MRLRETYYGLLFVAAVAWVILLVLLTSGRASSLQEAADATFQLWQGDWPICSATYIGHAEATDDKPAGDYFLTAAHCIDGDGFSIAADVRDAKQDVLMRAVYYADPVRTIENMDVSLLRTRAPLAVAPRPADIAQPGEFDELIGEPVVAIGYPFADERAITTGVFTGPVPGILGVEAPLYRATAQIAPGSSGGALWAEIAGTWKIIGTAFAVRRDAAWVSYFTTPDKIHALLRYTTPFSATRPGN